MGLLCLQCAEVIGGFSYQDIIDLKNTDFIHSIDFWNFSLRRNIHEKETYFLKN